MATLIGYVLPILRGRGRVLRPTRILAVAAIIALLTATIVPSWAVAAEPDSEGEGTAPPGLENPQFEPGGEEAALEVLPGAAESGGSAEEVEGAPIETEPAQEPELPEPAAEAAPPVAADAEPPPPAPEAPAPAPPEYAPAPEYVAPAPPAAPVENEPIVAPPGAAEPPPRSEPPPAQPEPQAAVPEAVVEAPPAVVPSGQGEAPPAAPAPAPASVAGSGGVSPPLHGRSSYTVHPGDCLWWIAEALLPSGASDAQIETKVARLWRINSGRIGTGDPNLLLVGTVLELA